MSLDKMMGSVRCKRGGQRELISFERFVGLKVRKPTRKKTCACPVVLCKFQQIIWADGPSLPGYRRQMI